MNGVYQVWCEWDVGQEGIAFETEEKALEWCHQDENLKELVEDYGKTIEGFFEEGYLSINFIELEG